MHPAMHPNTLLFSTTAVIASVFLLGACSRSPRRRQARPLSPRPRPPSPRPRPRWLPAAVALAPVAVAPAPVTVAPAALAATTPATPERARGGRGGGRKGGRGAVKMACAEDIKKFCPEGGKPGKCLRGHARPAIGNLQGGSGRAQGGPLSRALAVTPKGPPRRGGP